MKIRLMPITINRSAGAVLTVIDYLLLSYHDLLLHCYALSLPLAFEHSVDLFYQCLKAFLDIEIGFCTHLQKRNSIFFSYCRSFFRGYVSLVVKVALSAEQYLADIRRRVCFDLGHPSFNILKGSAIDNGVGEDNPCGPFVVSLRDILESLLSCSVPDLKLIPPVSYRDSFDLEVDSDSGDIGLFEVAFTESCDKVGLADSAIADNDDFGHEIVFI